MLTIKTFTVNPIQENCYIVSDETKECVIIDNGAFAESETTRINNYLQAEGLKLKVQLYTHGHFDHVMGSGEIYQQYGLSVRIHEADAALYRDCEQQLMAFLRISRPITLAPFGDPLDEQTVVEFGRHQLHVLHTPGHTPGGICLYCPEEATLFSGDTLFLHSVGRTDFPGGSYEALMNGIRSKILTLPHDTIVYPGHGPTTSVGEEYASNPYFRMV